VLDQHVAGDVLVVTRLDQLARSTRDLLNTLAAISGKKAGFSSLGDVWADTTTPNGPLDAHHGLRNFGNIGAHAGGVQLSENEVPVIDALCRAILEYVYGAPHLVALAQQTLDKVKASAGR
jgi:hypothetical protein